MVCRLIDFAFVILELLMFKVCGIIGISKINFSRAERVKRFFRRFLQGKYDAMNIVICAINCVVVSLTCKINILHNKKHTFKEGVK